MRYEIGSHVYVVKFHYGDGHDDCGVRYPYMWSRKECARMEILRLTVKEHHKVTDEYSDNKDYDGYILESDDGRKFYNQYPTASYSQTSTNCDFQFSTDNSFIDYEAIQQPYNAMVKGIDHFGDSPDNAEMVAHLKELTAQMREAMKEKGMEFTHRIIKDRVYGYKLQPIAV